MSVLKLAADVNNLIRYMQLFRLLRTVKLDWKRLLNSYEVGWKISGQYYLTLRLILLVLAVLTILGSLRI
jgi:hypothetical protein